MEAGHHCDVIDHGRFLVILVARMPALLTLRLCRVRLWFVLGFFPPSLGHLWPHSAYTRVGSVGQISANVAFRHRKALAGPIESSLCE